jgi:hypothetical protein
MDLKQIIEILKTHNNWRRGKINDTNYTIKELGIAIDEAIIILQSLNENK